jgi:hypothetical protein
VIQKALCKLKTNLATFNLDVYRVFGEVYNVDFFLALKEFISGPSDIMASAAAPHNRFAVILSHPRI